MTSRLVDAGWAEELNTALQLEARNLSVISPFLKQKATRRVLSHSPQLVRVITRFNLADFAEGVSDIAALRSLLVAGAKLRGVRNLHAKVYVFGSRRTIVTSANLTEAALTRNHEFGLVSDDAEIISASTRYFDALWECAGTDLTARQLDEWEQTVTMHLASGGPRFRLEELADYGADATGVLQSGAPSVPVPIPQAEQAFVKFLGEGSNRVPLSFSTRDEIDSALCHWALAYPATKRPQAVKEGAVMFIGRLTYDPTDIIIFGRAIGMRHVPGRDDASADEIAERSWKKTWSRYIRVHHAEFVAGTMANGISLNAMMNALGPNAFTSTQRNQARGEGNRDPSKAYRQQAAVELSSEGQLWLSERLQRALEVHGKVPQEELNKLGWPKIHENLIAALA
ncbi:phospholipase D family protein [Rhizobium phaseoli]|uniref:phospholipase D family protein n=1 Tax=Rhizobium phaseoli TaxID=396 RepID=UPI0007E9263E|nr:phospholipase D family protein [Rhizobium phaseoli]ANL33165.1 phospholipase D-like domain-containing protein [Rhizobium phaseoli]ANL96895.1 phospholipase D-like domain-containing protein [Rhizobium phaseoli]